MVSFYYRDARGQQHVLMSLASAYTSVLGVNPSVAINIHVFHM